MEIVNIRNSEKYDVFCYKLKKNRTFLNSDKSESLYLFLFVTCFPISSHVADVCCHVACVEIVQIQTEFARRVKYDLYKGSQPVVVVKQSLFISTGLQYTPCNTQHIADITK